MDPFTIAALATAGTEIVRGISSGNKAKKARGQYDNAMAGIPLYDPNQVAQLGDVRRRARAFEAGTDPFTSYTQQQMRNTGAQTMNNVVRAGGGVSDLLRVQRNTDQGLAGSGAYASQRAGQARAMEGQLVDAMAGRAYNRQLSDANRIWSEYAQHREASNSRIQAGLAMLPQIAMGFGAAKGASQYPGMSSTNTQTSPQKYYSNSPFGGQEDPIYGRGNPEQFYANSPY